MANISRRAVNIGAVWSVPVILTAVAAPTAAASPNPPVVDTNPCTNGTLLVQFLDLEPWNGKTLPQAVQITNLTDDLKVFGGQVENVSGHLVGLEGSTTFTPDPQKKGDGTYTVALPAHGVVRLRIVVETDADNSVGFLTLPDCGLRKPMKTVGFKDRNSTEGDGK